MTYLDNYWIKNRASNLKSKSVICLRSERAVPAAAPALVLIYVHIGVVG